MAEKYMENTTPGTDFWNGKWIENTTSMSS